MITPDEIRTKLLRRYPDFLGGWLRDESIFPLDLPVGKLPETWTAFREETDTLMRGSKAHQRHGYRVETEVRKSKRFGRQAFPVRVWVDDAVDFLALTGKRAEFEQFQADVMLIRVRLPELEAWLQTHTDAILKYHGEWAELIEVCAYFLKHPTVDRAVRELPINVHSKFIEQHTGILRSLLDALLPDDRVKPEESRFNRRYGLREADTLVRVRFLDHQFQTRYHAPLTDLSVPLPELALLDFADESILIVENLTTFLSLPPLPHTLAFFGRGFDAGQIGKITWLHRCPVFYWGDLDAQGFQILALLRRNLPAVQSLLMDRNTFDTFAGYHVAGTPTIVQPLPELTPDERQLYQWLAERSLRLEQERIDPLYVETALQAVFG